MPTRIRTNQILLLKMTPGEQSEAAALARGGPSRTVGPRTKDSTAGAARVLVIRDSYKDDYVRLGGRSFALQEAQQRRAFAEALGLSEKQARVVEDVLAQASSDSRDELAELARVLHWANTGKLDLRRIVLSGHVYAYGVRGDYATNGVLDLQHVASLARAFPRAAARVQHLMIAACWSSRPYQRLQHSGILESYRGIFPNLESVTGYRWKAPASGSGHAERDLRRWSRATRNGDSPTRKQVFGRCAGNDRASVRRQLGRVSTDKGPQQCAVSPRDLHRWRILGDPIR